MTTFRRITTLLALSLAAACGSSGGEGLRRAYTSRTVLDSMAIAVSPDTTYRRRLADLVRRSRLVRTDSLARLFAAVPRTPDSTLHLVRQAVGCETMILLRQHGAAAYQRAYERMVDSLVRSGFHYPDEVERMEAAPGPPLEFNGPDSCGQLRYPPVADSLANEPYPAIRMK